MERRKKVNLSNQTCFRVLAYAANLTSLANTPKTPHGSAAPSQFGVFFPRVIFLLPVKSLQVVSLHGKSSCTTLWGPLGSVRSEALRDVESIGTDSILCNKLATKIHLCPLHFLQMGSASYLSASSIDSMTTTAPCFSCKSAIKPLLPN